MAANGATPDWEEQAKFWQLKYFELLGHMNSVIVTLSRESLTAAMGSRMAARVKAAEDANLPKANARS
jgi:hypothetical protein